jgi:DNA primase
MASDIHYRALEMHRLLPPRLWDYLRGRGLSDEVIHRELLGWNGRRITIPIRDREGRIISFRLARDPEDRSSAPKMLSLPGFPIVLYGAELLGRELERIVICEGEFDRLVLLSRGFPAVTPTGGAFSFKPQWRELFRSIPEVFICFDRDQAGRTGARRVAEILPEAKIVSLPAEVGDKGDVSDFFVRLKRIPQEFEMLLAAARPLPAAASARRPAAPRAFRRGTRRSKPIEEVIGAVVQLKKAGKSLSGRCPFHDDEHPSLVVSPERGTFRCFACGVHGDAVEFLSRCEAISVGEAIRRLTNPHG